MSEQSTSRTHNVVVGQTAAKDIYLRDDCAVPEGTLGGTVDLLLADINGNVIDFSGDVSILDAATWKVRVSPDASDFATEGNYRGRFRVTDDLGKTAFFPDGVWDTWCVRSVR